VRDADITGANDRRYRTGRGVPVFALSARRVSLRPIHKAESVQLRRHEGRIVRFGACEPPGLSPVRFALTMVAVARCQATVPGIEVASTRRRHMVADIPDSVAPHPQHHRRDTHHPWQYTGDQLKFITRCSGIADCRRIGLSQVEPRFVRDTNGRTKAPARFESVQAHLFGNPSAFPPAGRPFRPIPSGLRPRRRPPLDEMAEGGLRGTHNATRSEGSISAPWKRPGSMLLNARMGGLLSGRGCGAPTTWGDPVSRHRRACFSVQLDATTGTLTRVLEAKTEASIGLRSRRSRHAANLFIRSHSAR
jgi:hypothetical protein